MYAKQKTNGNSKQKAFNLCSFKVSLSNTKTFFKIKRDFGINLFELLLVPCKAGVACGFFR